MRKPLPIIFTGPVSMLNRFVPALKARLGTTVSGGALYISVLVSILIGIMLSLFVVIARYNQRTVTDYLQSSQLYFNLESGVEIAQSAYFDAGQNNKWIRNTFNADSTLIKRCWWGAYPVISVSTRNRHHAIASSAIYGGAMTSDTGLVTTEGGRPVGVSGQVTFRAHCYLPLAGIRPAYIEGQNYSGSSGNASWLRPSPQTIPRPANELVEGIEMQRESSGGQDSIVSFLPDHYSRSFTRSTVVFKMPGSRIGGYHLTGNIKISASAIEVDSSCKLADVLLVCDKVRFMKGFKGNLHVIAADSISMEESCEFAYPSSFVLLPPKYSSGALRYIQFNKACRLSGGLLAINYEQEGRTSAQKVFIKLHQGSEINGFIYSSNYLHLEGEVNATAVCAKLLLKTPSAVYENHLLACTIDPKKYSHLLAVPPIFTSNQKLLCCKTL